MNFSKPIFDIHYEGRLKYSFSGTYLRYYYPPMGGHTQNDERVVKISLAGVTEYIYRQVR